MPCSLPLALCSPRASSDAGDLHLLAMTRPRALALARTASMDMDPIPMDWTDAPEATTPTPQLVFVWSQRKQALPLELHETEEITQAHGSQLCLLSGTTSASAGALLDGPPA